MPAHTRASARARADGTAYWRAHARASFHSSVPVPPPSKPCPPTAAPHQPSRPHPRPRGPYPVGALAGRLPHPPPHTHPPPGGCFDPAQG